MRDWIGKRYWLVGASDGLGAAVAQVLSRAGAHVFLSGRSADKLETLARSLPGLATALPLDVTDQEALYAAAEKIGEMDGVVYLAGVYWPFDGGHWDADQATQMAEVNYVGAIKVINAVLPRFVDREQGHIVLTGSLSGFRGLPGAAPYVSSKAGVMALAESLEADLWRSPVEVQLINPGFIKTRLTDKNDFSMPFILSPEDAARRFVDHMATNRFEHSFPRVFSWMFRIGRLLPNWLYYRLFA